MPLDTIRFSNDNDDKIRMIVLDGCEFCVKGTAEYQCLDCYADGMDSKMCYECKEQHIEDQPEGCISEIVKLPLGGKIYE